MEWFENGLRYVHVVFGFTGLVAFWVPVFSKKGAARHIRFGKIFLWSAYVVLGSAFVSVLYRLSGLLSQGLGPDEKPGLFSIWLFLGYLAFVTFVTVRHAVGVLRTKTDPAALRTPTPC